MNEDVILKLLTTVRILHTQENLREFLLFRVPISVYSWSLMADINEYSYEMIFHFFFKNIPFYYL